MRTADIVSCAVVTLFGLVLMFVIIPVWVPVEEGPDFGLAATTMPYVATTTVTALAVLFFIYRVRRPRAADTEDDATPPIPRRSWLFLLAASLFLIAMAFLFEYAGFLVAGPPTVAGFMVMMGERRIWPIAITSVAATAAIWAFFWQFLKFPLP